MRLLNTKATTLKEFFGAQIPYYAILSHRWSDEEVTFRDLEQGRGPEMEGWGKIVGCCKQARKEGWEWIWIDSCCIDKSSSAELSEAINSMFKWYEDAQVCYAYLGDVPIEEKDHESQGSAFRKSQWFTRGWTLQELLAPDTVVFFNHGWIDIGTKSSLDELIESITNIEVQYLRYFRCASVAQKFSWASKRQTLRVEDIAYSLMGLFEVNMPLLYGEGTQAFLRLQLQIMSFRRDDSLFAWADESFGEIEMCGLLAESPAAFQLSGSVLAGDSNESLPPYSMTNIGLRISLPVIQKSDWTTAMLSSLDIHELGNENIAPLNCFIASRTENGSPAKERIMLHLWRNKDKKSYWRTSCNRQFQMSEAHLPPQSMEEIFVRHRPFSSFWAKTQKVTSKLEIDAMGIISQGFVVSDVRGIHPPNDLRPRRNGRRFLTNHNTSDGRYYCQLGEQFPTGGLLVGFQGVQLRLDFVLELYPERSFCNPDSKFSIRLVQLEEQSLADRAKILQSRPFNQENMYDRATTTLQSRQVVSAALSTQLRDGELMYVVVLDVKPPSLDNVPGSTGSQHQRKTPKRKREDD